MPNYYDWQETYPQLKLLLDNIDILREEAATVGTVKLMMFVVLDDGDEYILLLYIIAIIF